MTGSGESVLVTARSAVGVLVTVTATGANRNPARKGEPGMAVRAPVLALIVYPEISLKSLLEFAT